MFVDDLKTARKVSLAILLATIQLVIIAAFGARWTSGRYYWWVGTHIDVPGIAPPYSTIIPFPWHADWWFAITAIMMYLLLVVCFLYIVWTVFQIALPNRIPIDLKMVVLVDVLFAGLLTIMLLIAYCFFAGGFSGKTYLVGLGYGYCFWFAVTSSISSFCVVLISGLSWYRNS